MVVTAGEDSEEGRKTLQISLVVFFRHAHAPPLFLHCQNPSQQFPGFLGLLCNFLFVRCDVCFICSYIWMHEKIIIKRDVCVFVFFFYVCY